MPTPKSRICNTHKQQNPTDSWGIPKSDSKFLTLCWHYRQERRSCGARLEGSRRLGIRLEIPSSVSAAIARYGAWHWRDPTHTQKKSRKIPENPGNPGKFKKNPVVNNAHTSSTVKSVIQQTSHLYGWLIRKIDECVDMHTWMKNTLKAVSENPGKSRKIPENSRKFGKLPENPGHARECTSKIPETPGQSRENKKVKIATYQPRNPGKSRKIPENPGNAYTRKSRKISANLGKL